MPKAQRTVKIKIISPHKIYSTELLCEDLMGHQGVLSATVTATTHKRSKKQWIYYLTIRGKFEWEQLQILLATLLPKGATFSGREAT